MREVNTATGYDFTVWNPVVLIDSTTTTTTVAGFAQEANQKAALARGDTSTTTTTTATLEWYHRSNLVVDDLVGPTRVMQPGKWYLGPFKTFLVLNRFPLLVRVGRLLRHCELLFHKDNYVRCVIRSSDGLTLRKAQDPALPVIAGKGGMSGPDPRKITLFDVDVGQLKQLQTIRVNIYATEGPIDARLYRFGGIAFADQRRKMRRALLAGDVVEPDLQSDMWHQRHKNQPRRPETVKTSGGSSTGGKRGGRTGGRSSAGPRRRFSQFGVSKEENPSLSFALLKNDGPKITPVASVERSLDEIEYILEELEPADAFARGYASETRAPGGPSPKDVLRKLLTAFRDGNGLAYPHRFQTGVRPVSCRMHDRPCHSV